MASTITAGNATNGLALSCDNTGILELKTGTGSGTTAVTIGTGQQVAVTLGSAAAPSITFSGDTNTGIFSPAADALGFVTNGTEDARFDSSGNFLVAQTAQTSAEKFGVTQSSTSASSARFYASSTSYTNDIVQISCARSGATVEYNALTVFDNNTTLKMLIRANGNLLNANNSYGSLSDQREVSLNL
jgi:hypothetical protein